MSEMKFRKSYEKEGFKTPVFEYRSDWPYLSIGFGDEKDYFIENLSLLIASGMGISNALSSLSVSVKSRKMKKVTKFIEDAVNAGLPLWKAFKETKLLPDRVISLIKSGEESGRLPEHLNLVTIQQHKDKTLNGRLKSALIYPGIVTLLAFIVAIGSAWFILPKITTIFTETGSKLPLATRILVFLGKFLSEYGSFVVPLIIISIASLFYFVFFYKKTKFIGDYILFNTPGVKKLLQGVELARFGYIFGALLQAGINVHDALDSVIQGTNYRNYKKFYLHLQSSIDQGNSFQTTFNNYPQMDEYVPAPIQQLIISSEKSGKLSETLIKIGIIFEEKTDAMSRDLSTMLEPIILIIVGLLVSFVVFAIIGPIYDLSSQI